MKNLSLLLCLISLCGASACSATAWHYAAGAGNVTELQQLIQTQPQNINQTDKDGFTPLHYAAYEGREAAIEILLDNGANTVINQADNDGGTPFYWAAFSGSVAAMAILLDRGATINLNQTEMREMTPLHRAARMGNLDVMEMFIRAYGRNNP